MPDPRELGAVAVRMTRGIDFAIERLSSLELEIVAAALLGVIEERAVDEDVKRGAQLQVSRRPEGGIRVAVTADVLIPAVDLSREGSVH